MENLRDNVKCGTFKGLEITHSIFISHDKRYHFGMIQAF